MAKVRISTTVDSDLLAAARSCCAGAKDASVMEQALRALLAEHSAAQIDQQIDAAYRTTDLTVADEWGTLDGFLAAATKAPGAAGSR